MCDAMSLMIGSMAGGSLIQGMGAMEQGKATRNEANYRAQMAMNNRLQAEEQAQDIERQGRHDAAKHRSRVRQFEADQLVSLAASGFDVSTGSAVDLLTDTAELGELDAQTILSDANRQAYNERVRGNNYSNEAALLKASGSNAERAGYLTGGGSLLSGAGAASATYLNHFGG